MPATQDSLALPVLQTTSNYIQLKQAIAPIGQAQQGLATTIGLLAHSGLNHLQLMPEMCRLLQDIFRLKSCGFFWSDAEGNMQDAWCLDPGFLSFKTLMNCAEYQRSGARTWPTFQENVLMGAVAGYLLPFQNDNFYASEHYRSTYLPSNIRHIIDVVLHDGVRPYGAFLMMRSPEQGPFTPDERTLLAKLIPILNAPFSVLEATKIEYAEKTVAGFALTGADGRYKSMSEEARRIVWMITHLEPGSFASTDDPSIEHHLEQLVATYRDSIETGERFSQDIVNRWGKFSLAFERETQAQDIILTLSRRLPLPSQLALCLIKYQWPPMRQIVAWLLAQNQSRKQIAAALGVSIETITSHIKLIYKETRTSSSHGLLLKLAG